MPPAGIAGIRWLPLNNVATKFLKIFFSLDSYYRLMSTLGGMINLEQIKRDSEAKFNL